MATGSVETIAEQSGIVRPRDFYMGSTDGQPNIYFILGTSPADVTARLQRLSGVTPRPPLWALGNHQCRWGYQSYADLDRLDTEYRRRSIPCDGLWLDIDYMDGFRVFTFNTEHFPEPDKQIREVVERGRKVVPILDPGVKRDPGYEVYEDGLRADIFCKNHSGDDYVGYVWPGETVFPDFSLASAREWWAAHVARFVDHTGISGAWLDMNDPSTGTSPLDEMLFQHGEWEHMVFHNQYALWNADGVARRIQPRPTG